MFRFLLFFALTIGAVCGQDNQGALTEVAFERLGDRNVSALGSKALAIRAADWKHAETENFVFHFFDRPTATAVSVEAEFCRRVITQELVRDAGAADRAHPKSHVFIFNTEDDWRQFQKVGGMDPWTGGIHSEGSLFIQRAIGWKSTNQILAHEITHLVMHRAFGGRVPLWLDEGFAEFAAGRCHSAFMRARGFDAKPRVMTVAPGQFLPLAQLTTAAAYPTADEAVATFYAESEKLVRFLSSADKAAFGKMIDTLAKGARLESALAQHYGSRFSSLDALEKEFRAYATTALVPAGQ